MPGLQKGKKHKPGAGRPRLFASHTVRYTITLPPELADAIRAYGGGGLSVGIRRLWLEHALSAPESAPKLR